MENRLNYEKLKAEIQNLTRRMDQMEKKASMYEEQFRETSKTVQSIDFNVNNLLKLFDKLESRMSNDQEILHKRIGSLNTPIPFSGSLEKEVIPTKEKIKKEIQSILSN